MLDSPDIKLTNPRTHGHESMIKDLISQGKTEQAARDEIAAGFRTMRSTPISNKLLIEQRRQLHEAQLNSMVDPLTGLKNRRYVFGNEKEPDPSGELKRLFFEAKRSGDPLSVIMLDIDKFKDINDKFSHEAGDNVLQQLASLFEKTIRESDIAARIGGEEFLIILQDTDLSGAKELAERIRKAVEVKNLNPDGTNDRPNNLTVSAGISTFTKESIKITSERELLNNADKALHFAKERGRNQTWEIHEHKPNLENRKSIFSISRVPDQFSKVEVSPTGSPSS